MLNVGPWSGSLISIVVVSVLPLAVTLIMARQEAVVRKILPQLTAFGAGAVFGAAALHLIPEALEADHPTWLVIAAIVGGYAAFWGVERALAGHDHAHAHGFPLGAPSAHGSDSSAAECEHLHPEHSAHARRLVPFAFAGDALHNIVDGMLIAAGFLAKTEVGLLALLAVALHELPREVGTFSLFVHGGIRPMRAVGYNAITAVLALLGALVTLLVGQQVGQLATWVLPAAAGSYLYIAQAVGRASLHDRQQDAAHLSRLGWAAGGVAAMGLGVFIR